MSSSDCISRPMSRQRGSSIARIFFSSPWRARSRTSPSLPRQHAKADRRRAELGRQADAEARSLHQLAR
jgi:hypothetical protein